MGTSTILKPCLEAWIIISDSTANPPSLNSMDFTTLLDKALNPDCESVSFVPARKLIVKFKISCPILLYFGTSCLPSRNLEPITTVVTI